MQNSPHNQSAQPIADSGVRSSAFLRFLRHGEWCILFKAALETELPSLPFKQRAASMPSAGVPLEEPDVLFRRSADLEIQAHACTRVEVSARTIVGGTIGYFGTYTVDEANKTITLRIEASSCPNQLGMDQKRTVSVLTTDELKYSNPVAMSGGKIDVAMRRAK
jgi:hypothetical protein